MAGNKYGDIDEMLSPDNTGNEISPKKRARRPSPALGVMTGDNRLTSVTDGLKADKQKTEEELKAAKEAFEKEKAELQKQIEDIRSELESKIAEAKDGRALEGVPIVLPMPVTKQEVSFELKQVDPSLIDVSPENERIQTFLDEISIQDILPSIKKHGQQKPGTLRPTEGGRYELIEGSRRLAAVKLAERQYLALVGEVPDADVRELSIIENKHQDVSPYEKAISYQRQIERGEFESWTQLGAAKGISSSHIARYKACIDLDELFVRILPSPSDMPLSYGETIVELKKKGEKPLTSKAKELLKQRNSALDQRGDVLDVEDVIKILKSSVRTKAEAPKSWKPIVYRSKDKKTSLKHTVTNQGATKFEIAGADETQLEKLIEVLKKTLKVDN